jgi:hypothetical protein
MNLVSLEVGMLLPDDPFDFVAPKAPDFRVHGWEHEFGPYQWFYLVGGQRLLAQAGLSDRSRASEMAPKASPPATWERDYPLFGWKPLAGNQVRRALKHKILCFDRACLAAVAITQAVETHGRPGFVSENKTTPASKWLRIKPATFGIAGFSPAVHSTLASDEIADVLARGYQRDPRFLQDIARGHGATFLSLEGIAKRLHATERLPVNQVYPRGERSTRAITPSKSEVVPVFLEKDGSLS